MAAELARAEFSPPYLHYGAATLVGDQNIVGLQVPVHDLVPVEEGHGAAELPHEAVVELGVGAARQEVLVHVAPVAELHDEPEEAGGFGIHAPPALQAGLDQQQVAVGFPKAVAEGLEGPAVLQDALLQLDDVFVLPLDALQGPEFLQSQLHVLGDVAVHPFHGHFASGLVEDGLVDHPVAPPAHFSDDAVLGFRRHPPVNQGKTPGVMTSRSKTLEKLKKKEIKSLKPRSSPTAECKSFQVHHYGMQLHEEG